MLTKQDDLLHNRRKQISMEKNNVGKALAVIGETNISERRTKQMQKMALTTEWSKQTQEKEKQTKVEFEVTD